LGATHEEVAMMVADALRRALRQHLSLMAVDLLMQRHVRSPAAEIAALSVKEREQLAEVISASVKLFSRADPSNVRLEVRQALQLGEHVESASGRAICAAIAIRAEVDVSVARSEAKRVATSVGVSSTMAVKVATAVSELARNIVLYAKVGAVELEALREGGIPLIRIVARDAGPGIDPARVEQMFAGTYRSKSGLGKGLLAVKRIANEFALETALGKGTTVRATFRGGL
jgi:serine/threonine-protein kinase RsbT